MEEESEEREEEIQDSEYDGYFSDEDDRRLYEQFRQPEPTAKERQALLKAYEDKLTKENPVLSQKLLSQADLKPKPAIMALNQTTKTFLTEPSNSVFDVEADKTQIAVQDQDENKQDQEVLVLNEEMAQLKAKNEAMATQILEAKETTEMDKQRIAELEQRLKAFEAEREEMAELKAKNEAMAKKIEEEELK